MNKLIFVLAIIFVLFSCKRNSESGKKPLTDNLKNQLLISSSGDSIEVGYWEYKNQGNEVSKTGNYEDGLKINSWTYEYSGQVKVIRWGIYNGTPVKFNYPENLKIIKNNEYPTIFLADIPDNDENTYLTILEHDVRDESLDFTYDYLYQANERRMSDTVEVMKYAETIKIYYPNVEIFKYYIETERSGKSYKVISFIFQIEDKLYDLTIKNIAQNMNMIDYDIFDDILYSAECNGVDLFSFGANKSLKIEEIRFE